MLTDKQVKQIEMFYEQNRKAIIDQLEKEPMTCNKLILELRKNGIRKGYNSIYKQLENMQMCGLVKRFSKGSRYEYYLDKSVINQLKNLQM